LISLLSLLQLPVDIYFVLFALLAGSFINLAVDRVPRGESVISPRSHCRSCGRILNAVDLLPVAGYFIRGGRCATCRTSIGIGAPAVEATSCGLMLVSIIAFGPWAGVFIGVSLLLVFLLLAIGVSLARRERAAASGR
jgi:prepilin signal peptidase PulO-like enzyme (type II secretory pathway)